MIRVPYLLIMATVPSNESSQNTQRHHIGRWISSKPNAIIGSLHIMSLRKTQSSLLVSKPSCSSSSSSGSRAAAAAAVGAATAAAARDCFSSWTALSNNMCLFFQAHYRVLVLHPSSSISACRILMYTISSPCWILRYDVSFSHEESYIITVR